MRLFKRDPSIIAVPLPASSHPAARGPRPDLRRHLPIAIFVLGGTSLTLAWWRAARVHEEHVAYRRHAGLVDQAASGMFMALEREVSAELSAIPAVVSFYDSSKLVEPEEFATFTNGALERYAGVEALAWAPRVDGEELGDFLSRARALGVDLDGIHTLDGAGHRRPVDSRPGAYPVLYAAHRPDRPDPIGLDLASTADFADLVAASTAAGALRVRWVDAPIPTVAEARQLIAAAPVVDPGDPSGVRGVVVGVYDLQRMTTAALGADPHVSETAGGIDLYLFGGEGPPDRMPLHVQTVAGMARAAPLPLDAIAQDTHVVHELHLGDSTLLVVARPRTLHPPTAAGALSWTILLGGVALTSALGAIFQALTGRNRTIAALVAARTAELARTTAELAERERRLRAILDTTLDGIVTIDETGRIRTVNAAMGRLFGYDAADLVDQPITVLLPEHSADAHRHGFEEHLRSPRGGLEGVTIEAQGQRRDGSLFEAEVSITELRGDGPPGFLGVVRDISKRKEVARLKDRFISTVSHELRTPLTSMLGALELLREGVLGPLTPKAKEMVTTAYDSGERLVRLINDILDLERLGTGRMDLHRTDFDAAALLTAIASANQGLARAHDVRIVAELPERPVQVHADQDRIVQVLTNLVGNAARFSPAGGVVALRVERRGDDVVFAVQDEGPGIPEQFRPFLFAPFSQADASDTRRLGGTGLGLSIAKAIVEEHGGRIWYNTQEGRGTTFFFSVPGPTDPAPGPRP